MSYLIAVSGKGGVGKTTISGLLVNQLIKMQCSPVLAVDADPNTCLDDVLGVKVEKSIGTVREDARKEASKGLGAGISKQQLLEMKIAESLVEASDFDLIAMGRSEGPGCYCYANNVLKSVINEISSQYPFVVLDNEAGLENLSRRIVQKVDLMVMVTDPSARGLRTVNRLHAMTGEMNIEYDKLAIIINRTRSDELPDMAEKLQKEIDADFLVGLGDDSEIALFAEQGKSLLGLSNDNKVASKLDSLLCDAGVSIKL